MTWMTFSTILLSVEHPPPHSQIKTTKMFSSPLSVFFNAITIFNFRYLLVRFTNKSVKLATSSKLVFTCFMT